MSHFYGVISESARKTEPTARAHKSTGIELQAQSWEGKIVVQLQYDEETKKDMFFVYRKAHKSSQYQKTELLCKGNIDMSDGWFNDPLKVVNRKRADNFEKSLLNLPTIKEINIKRV
jgi:hypothetical protein